MKKALWICFVFVLLFCMPIVSLAEDLFILPLSAETNAVVMRSDDECILIGGSNSALVSTELYALDIDHLTYCIPVCDHAEHVSALEELAQAFNASIIIADEAPSHLSLSAHMESGILYISTDKGSYAFGASYNPDTCITFGCDGSLFPFFAQTNEASVNVRADTSTKANRVGKLTRGSVLTVTAIALNTSNELWYKVLLENGTSGYIRSDLLQFISATDIVQPTDAPESEGTRYIGNKKSKVFHLPSCHSLPSSKNQVYFSSRDYAISKGYKPCSKCKP